MPSLPELGGGVVPDPGFRCAQQWAIVFRPAGALSFKHPAPSNLDLQFSRDVGASAPRVEVPSG
jgi:hypothetical protein